jgi:hypothetical protein
MGVRGMRAQYKILDTFDGFERYWSNVSQKSINQKLRLWKSVYMSEYPELLEKQIKSYKEDGIDWEKIAMERIFPKLDEWLPLMKIARENLLSICGTTYELARRNLKVDFPIVFVLYVGLGAGWATQYKSQPACLLGLEKIAELKWHSRKRLKSLLVHEIGHLIHMQWRNEFEKFEMNERDPLFLIYSEGFAKRYEFFILGEETWNEANDENWISWCRRNEGLLAKEYLYRVESGKSVNEFFGDWLDIKGKSQTGYYLGWRVIQLLEEKYYVKEIATLPFEKVKKEVKECLRHLAADLI